MADPQQPSDPTQQQAGVVALSGALRVCFRLLVGVLAAAILVFVWRSFFVVEQYESGLVLRFGRLVGTTTEDQVLGTGLHVTLPAPFDVKIRIPKRVQTVESSTHWYAEDEANPDAPPPSSLRPGVDGYTLTGDMAILHSKWVLNYKVSSPVQYAFAFAEEPGSFKETNDFLRRLLDSTVTEVCGSMSIDEAWGNREVLRARVQESLAKKIEKLPLGIDSADLEVLPLQITPPRQVMDSFLAATKAAEDKQRIISEAESYADQMASESAAEAARLRAQAEAYQNDKKLQAEADLKYFQALVAQYKANPKVVRDSLFQDRMKRILAAVGEKFVFKGDPNEELRLQLNREPDDVKKP